MNIRDAILERQSIRTFKNENILDKHLKDILYLATKAPSSFNGQQTSIIYTRDREKIKKVAELCGNQPQVANCNVFILLVTDLYRAKLILKEKGLELSENLDDLYDMAKIDAGLMAYLINLAAHSYGYGSTVIGGVLNNKEKLKKLFELPEEVEIAIGLTLGVPSDNYSKINTKPKLSHNIIAMEDKYNLELSHKALLEYEEELDKWFKSIGVNQSLYTEVLVKILAK